ICLKQADAQRHRLVKARRTRLPELPEATEPAAGQQPVLGEASSRSPALLAAHVPKLLERLRVARSALAARPRAARVAGLDQVVRWGPGGPRPRRGAPRRIAKATGYSAPMVEVLLRRTLEAWRGDALAALLDSVLAPDAALGAAAAVEGIARQGGSL